MCTGYAAERNNSELELVRREGKSGAEYEKRLVDVRDARNNSYGVAGFSVVGIGLGLAGLAGIEYSERKRG
jgi:hypothetical protein